MSPHYLVKCKTFLIWLKVMLCSSKHWWLWEEPVVMCGNWNVKQATSEQVFKVTTFCTDMLPVFFATNQLHSPPRSGEIQPMLQQRASATRPYCGFILDTSTLAACPIRRGNLPGWGQDCWLATRTDELGCLMAQKLDCVTTTMCWHMFPAMLRIADSSFCVSNTSR